MAVLQAKVGKMDFWQTNQNAFELRFSGFYPSWLLRTAAAVRWPAKSCLSPGRFMFSYFSLSPDFSCPEW